MIKTQQVYVCDICKVERPVSDDPGNNLPPGWIAISAMNIATHICHSCIPLVHKKIHQLLEEDRNPHEIPRIPPRDQTILGDHKALDGTGSP